MRGGVADNECFRTKDAAGFRDVGFIEESFADERDGSGGEEGEGFGCGDGGASGSGEGEREVAEGEFCAGLRDGDVLLQWG